MADNEQKNSNQVDDYQLVNVVATGAVSQIWEVRHTANQQQYAMKLLLPEAFADKALRAAIKSEAVLTKSFEHPNIIRVHDITISRDHAYFIMEYFRGANVKQMIRSERPAVESRAKRVMECLTQALAFIHDKGWVHKDVKPDNVLLTKGNEVRLIDFSLAQKTQGALTKLLVSKSRVVIQGTRTYLAPELIQKEPVTPAADMYSLGVSLYEILCGRAPFVMGNPNDLLMAHVRDTPEKPSGYNPNVTNELDQLVMRMLAKKPKDRPASMHEVISVVRQIKFFKQEPEDYYREKFAAADSRFADGLSNRLDSRTDAARSPEERAAAATRAKRLSNVMGTKRAEEDKPAPATSTPAPTPTAAAAQAPPAPQPMMMPGMPMQMPGMMMPGMPMQMPGMQMPGVPMPGMPMPGMPMPGMPMPGMPMPQMPGMPMPMPGMPQVPGMPQMPGMAAPAGARPAPAAPQTPARPTPPKKESPPDDIPLMDELPDVM